MPQLNVPQVLSHLTDAQQALGNGNSMDAIGRVTLALEELLSHSLGYSVAIQAYRRDAADAVRMADVIHFGGWR